MNFGPLLIAVSPQRCANCGAPILKAGNYMLDIFSRPVCADACPPINRTINPIPAMRAARNG